MDAAPLLEEKGDSLATTEFQDLLYPALLHWASSVPAFTADYCPIYAGNVKVPKILKQGLDGEKLDRRGSSPKMFDSRETIAPIFNAYTPPNVP